MFNVAPFQNIEATKHFQSRLIVYLLSLEVVLGTRTIEVTTFISFNTIVNRTYFGINISIHGSEISSEWRII